MGWWEDWGETALNIVTGGLYGLAKEGGREAANLAHEASAPQPAQGAVTVNYPGRGGPRIPAFPGVRLPSPPRSDSQSGGASDGCCDRFQLENGLLLDKTTGSVWAYDQAGKAFVFVPMKPAAEHEKVAAILLERELAKISREYADEVLGTLPQAARSAQAAEFEKNYIEPLRAAIRNKGTS